MDSSSKEEHANHIMKKKREFCYSKKDGQVWHEFLQIPNDFLKFLNQFLFLISLESFYRIFLCISRFVYKSTPIIDDTKQNKIKEEVIGIFFWLVVLKNQCGPSRHLLRFSTISWGGLSCTSLVICCGPSRHFPRFSTISWGEDLVQALLFCWSIFFARVLVEVQFLGYKFGLKGSTYTRENTVIKVWYSQ